jgi:carbonic anhydrase/acetyltransferase-like protein (isoleucine patch superfamily)
VIRTLWHVAPDDPLAPLLPRDRESLQNFYHRLRAFVAAVPRVRDGDVDPRACVDGEIISMGPGSVIEAGAIVHASCRLILGARSIVRAGAVLRDEVVVGSDCLIGVHCEVVRSVILGPRTYLGHFNYVADSIIGGDVIVAGNVMVANTTVTRGGSIALVHNGVKTDSGRSHLGALVGDGVRFGASTTVCPGCIVLPRLTLPPSVTLYGTIDAARRRALMRHFSRTWTEGLAPRPARTRIGPETGSERR